MKSILIITTFIFSGIVFTQTTIPFIKIDGDTISALNEAQGGLRLPFWLDSSQTLEIGDGVKSISVIEFDVSGGSLAYSDVVNVTTIQTVPANRVWKVESIAKDNAAGVAFANSTSPFDFSGKNRVLFDGVGDYEFVIPPGITSINVQAWGAGGGSRSSTPGAGGGYAITNLTVTPSTTIYVRVGAGSCQGGTSGANGEHSGIGTAIGLTDVVRAEGGDEGNAGTVQGGGFSTTYGMRGSEGYEYDGSVFGGSAGSYTEDLGGIGAIAYGDAVPTADIPATIPGGGGVDNGSSNDFVDCGARGRVIIKY